MMLETSYLSSTYLQNLRRTKNVISRQYADFMKDAKESGNGQVTKGALNEMIQEMRKKKEELKKKSHL